MTQPVIFHVEHDCGTELIVMPSIVFTTIRAASGSVEAELATAQGLTEITDDYGRRMVIADVEGVFTCPACEKPGRVPLGI